MKLHIGGEQEKEGWTIFNTQRKTENNIIGDICDLSQFEDESIDEIYGSHVLEHVRQKDVQSVLKGIHRVLKKNGKLYISVPDLDVLCHTMLSSFLPFEAKMHVMRMIFGGQIDEYDFHYFGWNYDFMERFTLNAGFIKCEKVKGFGLFEDTSNYEPYGFPISLNIIAQK
jgi:predicted SAM-dependent methyltransferase